MKTIIVKQYTLRVNLTLFFILTFARNICIVHTSLKTKYDVDEYPCPMTRFSRKTSNAGHRPRLTTRELDL